MLFKTNLNSWCDSGCGANIGNLDAKCGQRLTKIIEDGFSAIWIRDRQDGGKGDTLLGHRLSGAREIVDR